LIISARGAPFFVVTDCGVHGLIRLDVILGLISMQGSHGGLRIEVDSQNPISLKREILGEMSSSGRLTAPALEIDDGHDLAMLARPTPGNVILALGIFVQDGTNLVNLVEAVPSSAARTDTWLRPLTAQGKLTKVGIADAYKLRRFHGGKGPKRLFRDRWEKRFAHGK
jgi:hypothetical protein